MKIDPDNLTNAQLSRLIEGLAGKIALVEARLNALTERLEPSSVPEFTPRMIARDWAVPIGVVADLAADDDWFPPNC